MRIEQAFLHHLRLAHGHRLADHRRIQIDVQILRRLPDHVDQFARQAGAVAPPRNQNPRNLQPRVAVAPHVLHRVKKLLEPLQREHLEPHRNHHVVRRRQRVERQHAQRGRAVHDDVVVGRGDRVAQPAQQVFAPHAGELHIRRGQVERRRDQIHALPRRLNHVRSRRVAPQRLVQPGQRIVRPHRKGQIALRVAVDRQYALTLTGEPHRQRMGRRRLRNAALLIDQCRYPSHSAFPLARVFRAKLHMLRMLHAPRMPDMLHIPHILRMSPRHYTKRAAQRQIHARTGRFSPDWPVLKKGGSCSRTELSRHMGKPAFSPAEDFLKKGG